MINHNQEQLLKKYITRLHGMLLQTNEWRSSFVRHEFQDPLVCRRCMWGSWKECLMNELSHELVWSNLPCISGIFLFYHGPQLAFFWSLFCLKRAIVLVLWALPVNCSHYIVSWQSVRHARSNEQKRACLNLGVKTCFLCEHICGLCPFLYFIK